MKSSELYALKKAKQLISTQIGILNYISKLPVLHGDPQLIAYGIYPCDSTRLGALRFSGRSSGCGYNWRDAILSTLGEVVERYCPTFYNRSAFIKSSYNQLDKPAVHPNDVALFHPRQYEKFNFPFVPFSEDQEVHWAPCLDLKTGKERWFPASLIYLPWAEEEELIGLSTSTGLAAHTNFYKAVLNGLYELVERDAFVMTWMHNIVPAKILIAAEIESFLRRFYPPHYEYHFFDITYDIKLPTVLGMCFGKAEYGDFVAVGSACRSTFAEALDKVIKEMGQAVSYFRYLLGVKRDWYPNRFEHVHNFEEHSIFYLKRTDLWHVFDVWRDALPTKVIDFEEKRVNDERDEVKRILRLFVDCQCDILLKNLTTSDALEAGYHSVKVISPQLVQLGGDYNYYFLGGERLYDVPGKCGYQAKSFDRLNPYPHPFP
ncbi:hypothetical protein EH223_14125 [candidate division KSB1 bacterium]|nr:YcaO-like family protein [candidate division KSB1 bacterium]RQW01828.1 MAG: hypothetical protein EH223_14125 [candidate division KSB1 bacterium]